MKHSKSKFFAQKGTLLAMGFLIIVVTCFIKSIKSPLDAIAKAFVNRNMDLSSLQEKIDTSYKDNFAFKYSFVDINGLYHKILLQREMNDVILLNNGHASMLMSRTSDTAISNNVDSVCRANEYLKKKGITFLFCQEPYKNEDGNSQLPAGAVDYSNEVADRFLEALNQKNVPYLDLRACIEEDGIDLYSLFLKTEHHWSPKGGFYAFTKICEYMNKNYGDQIDENVMDLDNYYQELCTKKSSGYYGKRTGILFLPEEDFTLIYPKFETEQSCEIVHKNIVRSGSFYDAIFDMSKIESTNREGLYSTYIGGDYPLVIHESKSAKCDKTVMLFIDSFGVLPESFLTTAYKHVYAVDLRWIFNLNAKETMIDLVERYHPDHVIIAINPNIFGSALSGQLFEGM